MLESSLHGGHRTQDMTMTDDGPRQSTIDWPLPKFHFDIHWGSIQMRFQEVSGLDVESQPIEDRAGNEAAVESLVVAHEGLTLENP
jgi:hypothetical protein